MRAAHGVTRAPARPGHGRRSERRPDASNLPYHISRSPSGSQLAHALARHVAANAAAGGALQTAVEAICAMLTPIGSHGGSHGAHGAHGASAVPASSPAARLALSVTPSAGSSGSKLCLPTRARPARAK